MNAALAPHKAELLAVKRELKATRAELDLVRGGGGGGAPRGGGSDGRRQPPRHGDPAPARAAAVGPVGERRRTRRVVVEGEAEAVGPISYERPSRPSAAAELRRHAAVSARLEAVVGDPELDEELRKLLPRDYGKRKGFSTRLVNQHFVENLEGLRRRANVVHEKFDDVVRRWRPRRAAGPSCRP